MDISAMNQLKDWVKTLEQVKNWSPPQKIALTVAGVVIFIGCLNWIDGAEYRELERQIEATTEKIERINEESKVEVSNEELTEASLKTAESNAKPDIEIGMSQSSAVAAVNQFISQHGGSYDCGSFPEDPNYQICVYSGDESLEFHVESGSVVKIF